MDVLSLQDGNFIIHGLSEKHLPLTTHGKGITCSGQIEVEIISIGLVNPQPKDPKTHDLKIRLLKGELSMLLGSVLFFDV